MHYHEFSTLAASYLDQLYNTAKRLTGNAQDAEDLVQETYQRAFQTWRQLSDPARCRAWLYQIMRRLFIDAYRRKRATPELVVIEGGSETDDTLLAIPVGGVEEEVIQRLSVEEIRRALSLLPEELRTALLLHSLEGFTYPEIAEILGCPVSTVRTRIARARQKLLVKLHSRAKATNLGRRRTL
ncbi:MAG TPA: sigma-70 family RNA polymerase sigma factor [Candidatus Binatia bacterium]|nr:sigma-70 family RNA polymerase sigma factor [Candidatus Binatia bacterium]